MAAYDHGGDVYGRNIIWDFSANISPLGLPDGVRKALEQSLEDCSRYPDAQCRVLRQELSAFHGVEKNQIICGNGAADLIFQLVWALKPKRALVLAPTFGEYEKALRLAGCQVEYCWLKEEDGFKPRLSEIREALSAAPELFFLCNPNNPTGIPLKKEEVLEIAGICSRFGVFLVVDESFCEFLHQPEAYSVIPELRENPHMWVLKSFTKLYAMAGVRLGYGLGAEKVQEKLKQVRQPWSVSSMAQAAGAAALKEKDYVKRVQCLIETERPWLKEQLSRLGFSVYDSRANYLFFKSGNTSLYEDCLERQVLIRSCHNFPGLDSSYYRICVKTREENEKLCEILWEIGRKYR